jgi:uncharacterized protein (DUF3084 family)
MTETPETPAPYNNGQPPSRLDRMESILLQVTGNLNRVTEKLDRVAAQQEATESRLTELTYKVDDFISTANSVLARTTIVDGMVFELREVVVRLDANADRLQANFEENQKSSNAALERLGAILMRLVDQGTGDGHT